MSSTLKPLTLGRQPEDGQTRAAMLSRLGIVQEKPADTYAQPEPEPAAQVEALAAPPPQQEAPAPSPALERLRAWARPANDQQVEPAEEKPAFAIPAPPEEALEEEDPFEAIRQKYRNPPKTMALAPGITLPSSLPIPELPAAPFKMVPVGERRRKAGELSTSRKIIWGLSWLAAALIGWSLLTGDENNMIVQVFGLLLP